MIVRSDAIVLRTLKYGETSLIVTVLTRKHGKISVLAKGARLTKSRFGSALQPMSYVQLVYYYKPSRTLQMLSEAAHLEPFYRLTRDLDRLGVGLSIIEMAGGILHDEEPAPAVFNLLLSTLYRLHEAETRFRNLLPFFQVRLAGLLGFAPDIDREAVRQLAPEGGLLNLETGAVVPVGAPPARTLRASREALRAFAIFGRADPDVILRMHLTDAEYQETLGLVESFLKYHLPDAYRRRVEKVMHQMEEPVIYPEPPLKVSGGA